IPVGPRGLLEAGSVARIMDESVAAVMVTNPNTLGLFEDEIESISAAVHAHGGLVYMDGANMNALMGVARPGDMGVDGMQFNLNKPFPPATGGGRAGGGAVRGPPAARALPADPPPHADRAGIDVERGRAEERRPGTVVLRQLRHPRTRVCVHRTAR